MFVLPGNRKLLPVPLPLMSITHLVGRTPQETRSMKSIRTTLLFCTTLVAVAAFAVQNPTSPSSGQSQSPQTSQGTMHPDQQAPSSPSSAPTTREDQQPQGSTQPSQGQQEQSQQAGRPSIDDQVRMLTTELNLSPDQQTKLRSILSDQHQQAMTVVNDTSLSRDQKVEKIKSLRETTITKARAIMNDEQKTKLDSMLQQQQQIHAPAPSGQQGQSTTPPPSSNTPPKQ